MLPQYTGPQPSKKTIWLAFGSVAFWALIISTGRRLPYLYTEFAFQLRAYVLFPILFAVGFYASFLHRTQGQVGYKHVLRQFPVGKERIKASIMLLIGLFLIPGGLAWTSVAFPAWANNLFATKDYERAYRVAKIRVRGGSMWSTLFDLDLDDASSVEEVTLRLDRRRWEQHHWQEGEWICVQGRTSVFGTIIDAINTDVQSCGK